MTVIKLAAVVALAIGAQTSRPLTPDNQPTEPVRIADNLYFVGASDISSYLITTPAGHILIDTALQESGPIVRGNIESLGFKLTDIKIMLSSHSHFDHVAGHADI